MNDPSGSNWRKWDLHIHSPASAIQHYGPRNSNAAWEKFVSDLEALPPEFKAIGINDYNFIDGYEKTLEFKKNGRLKNIDLILPVIEFRVDTFVGVDNWREINYHVIFSEEVDPSEIKAQFLNGIESKYALSSQYSDSITWDALHTPESMIELGKQIQSTVPASEKEKFDNHFHVGFSNLVCPMSKLEEALSKPRFENKFVTAIGLSEWGQLRWTDQSIASKKSHINSVDFSFTASKTLENYERSSKRLQDSCVNERLLHCSDAHYFSSDIKNHNRIGNCMTWVKANPTFYGLKHALYEYSERVFVGLVPPKITSVDSEPTRYIKSIELAKKDGAKACDEWFENVGTIELNSGLVSVIGNQGSGKSALTDILGLVVHSENQKDFSFLSEKSFTSKKDKLADAFEVTITMVSGDRYNTPLDYKVKDSDSELARYIPQRFFDRICADIETKGSQFERQLHNTIFSHIPVSERHDQTSLDDLRSYLTEELEKSVEFHRSGVRQLNTAIVEIENHLKPDHLKALENALEKKEKDLVAHIAGKPKSVKKPTGNANKALQAQIDTKKLEITALEEQIRTSNKSLKVASDLAAAYTKAKLQLDGFELSVTGSQTDFDKLGIPIKFKDVVTLGINRTPIENGLAKAEIEKTKQQTSKDKSKASLGSLNTSLANLTKQLDEPAKAFEKYEKDLQTWRENEKKITGDANAPDTLEYYKNEIAKIALLPARLRKLKNGRLDRAIDVYKKIGKLAEEYGRLYEAVQQFIDNDDLAKTLDIDFSVSIVQRDFVDRFLNKINKTKKGFFRGKDDELSDLLAKCNLNSETDVRDWLTGMDELLSKIDSLSEILLVDLSDLYNFVFSLEFIEPTYVLHLFGKEIERLSPGERGSLLIIFYLLVDRDRRPLIIDQPEGNLDSQYIYQTLVEAIRRAKRDRQIIIVTHNPNLAVGCDAEQLIHASIDRSAGIKVVYEAGAIEDPKFKGIVMDKLEGTKAGFDNRKDKYAFGLPE